jgi:hypothetical protein
MQQKLLGLNEFQKLSASKDELGLLKVIKTTTYQFEGRQYPPHALHPEKRRISLCSQAQTTTIASHYKTLLFF